MNQSDSSDERKQSLLSNSMYMNGIQAKTSNIPLLIRLLLPVYKTL